MILVLLIAGCTLALAVLACVAIDPPVSLGDAAGALAGVPFPSREPEPGRSPERRRGAAGRPARRRRH